MRQISRCESVEVNSSGSDCIRGKKTFENADPVFRGLSYMSAMQMSAQNYILEILLMETDIIADLHGFGLEVALRVLVLTAGDSMD